MPSWGTQGDTNSSFFPRPCLKMLVCDHMPLSSIFKRQKSDRIPRPRAIPENVSWTNSLSLTFVSLFSTESATKFDSAVQARILESRNWNSHAQLWSCCWCLPSSFSSYWIQIESNGSINIWAGIGCLGVLENETRGLCQSKGNIKSQTAVVEHFELQVHTKIPASDLEKDGAGRVLSMPNESQCVWGCGSKPKFCFFNLPIWFRHTVNLNTPWSPHDHPII